MKGGIAIIIVALFGASLTLSESYSHPNQLSDKKIIKGTLIQKKSYNKAGRELPGLGDYYLKIKKKEYFIKVSESTIDSEELKSLLGQKTKYEVIFSDGLWDTDDPNVQSRIGEYIVILHVLDH
jgi:hypothetical protein